MIDAKYNIHDHVPLTSRTGTTRKVLGKWLTSSEGSASMSTLGRVHLLERLVLDDKPFTICLDADLSDRDMWILTGNFYELNVD